MAPTQDDEDQRTLGLPPGALDKVLKDNRAKAEPKDKGRPAATPPPDVGARDVPRPPAPPRKRADAPVASPWPGPPDSGGELNTIPPAAGARRRFEPPAPEAYGPGEGPLAPKPGPPPAQARGTPPGQDRPASPPPAPPPERPSSATPVGGSGWPGADSDVSIWGKPQGFDTAPPPLPTRPVKQAEEARRPAVPDDPWGAPTVPPVSPTPRVPTPRPDEGDTSTPVHSPGLNQMSPATPAPPSAPKRQPTKPASEYDGMTRGVMPPQKDRKLSRPVYTLQFYNGELQRWSDLGEVRPEGHVFGRNALTEWDDNPESIADEHFRLSLEDDRLSVEPLESLNGVYLKLRPNRPVGLRSGSRFRIGHHVLAYRAGGVSRPTQPLRSEEGEVFQSRVLVPRGYLDLIGVDGEPYLCFPLTKIEAAGTRIGRGGSTCDIALSEDDWVSSFHARVFHSGQECLLEDTGSTNGTFVEIREPTTIHPGKITGNPLRPQAGPARGDDCDVLLVGGYFLRVVDERA